jgi:hypothetical protein
MVGIHRLTIVKIHTDHSNNCKEAIGKQYTGTNVENYNDPNFVSYHVHGVSILNSNLGPNRPGDNAHQEGLVISYFRCSNCSN